MKQEEVKSIARRYPRVIRWSDIDNCYIGTLPGLAGDCTDAQTPEQVARQLDEVAEMTVEDFLEEGKPLPEPKNILVNKNPYSGENAGYFIRVLRDYRSLTQKELARLVGCSLSTLVKWENGTRRPSGAAARLLAVLDECPELVYGTELRA